MEGGNKARETVMVGRRLDTYARQARNLDTQNRAAEIRVRTERRRGQLLEAMRLGTGPGRGKMPGHGEPSFSEYGQANTGAGMSDAQAKRSQKMAKTAASSATTKSRNEKIRTNFETMVYGRHNGAREMGGVVYQVGRLHPPTGGVSGGRVSCPGPAHRAPGRRRSQPRPGHHQPDDRDQYFPGSEDQVRLSRQHSAIGCTRS